MKRSIQIIDSYYPDAIASMPIDSTASYESQLASVLDHQFGTSDSYSHWLRQAGWDATDVIANHSSLQELWLNQNNVRWIGRGSPEAIVLEQIEAENPDVVFMQDLSLFDAATLGMIARDRLLAGQCSCALPTEDRIRKFGVIFTSLPTHIEAFESLGVKAHYRPLAFDPRFIPEKKEEFRPLDISFVGGVGKQSHWNRGTNILEAVAAAFKERFHWFGYGLDNLEPGSPLRNCYRGPAWGRAMYEIYGSSKIVVNRHGEVAQGFTNNMRCFEACGAGAMLMTEASPNLFDLFPIGGVGTYDSIPQLLDRLNSFLEQPDVRQAVAECGHRHTMQYHSYQRAMEDVSHHLERHLRIRMERTDPDWKDWKARQ